MASLARLSLLNLDLHYRIYNITEGRVSLFRPRRRTVGHQPLSPDLGRRLPAAMGSAPYLSTILARLPGTDDHSGPLDCLLGLRIICP